MTTPILISNSEIQTWKDCRRKWWLAYYRELGLKRSEESQVGARQLGTRIHVALEALYADGTNPIDTVNELYAQDIQLLQDSGRSNEVVDLQKEQDLAKAMLEGYLEWIADSGVDEGIELVATEAVIQVPSGVDGYLLRGKLDQRVVRKRDGARLFMDHKTVQNLTDPPRILPMDEQMKFYHLLEKLDAMYTTGDEQPWRTDGALYNMLRKVKRTATAKPPFYERLEVHHNRAEIESMWWRVQKVISEIKQIRDAFDGTTDWSTDEAKQLHQYWAPPRPNRDCTWKCDFFPVCKMFDDGSNVEGLLGEYYEHRDPHERYVAEDDKKGTNG